MSPTHTLAAPAAPFEPTFETVLIRWFMPPPGIDPLDPEKNTISDREYATAPTADALQAKFGAVGWVPMPPFQNIVCRYTLADFRTPAQARQLIFDVGTVLKDSHGNPVVKTKVLFTFNAGVLADEYRRNPEAKFPGTSYQTGNPPETVVLLSLAEQNAWGLLRGAYYDEAAKKEVS